MICEHLRALEQALIGSGAKETDRGRVWTRNCREFVYYDVVLDVEALAARFAFAPCVRVSENTDPKSGLERGFWCSACHDGVMGRLSGAPVFR